MQADFSQQVNWQPLGRFSRRKELPKLLSPLAARTSGELVTASLLQASHRGMANGLSRQGTAMP